MKNIHQVSRMQGVIGLIGKKEPESIYLQTRWGIHTFFMRFPIDVVILDDEYHIAAMKEHLVPWRIFIWNPRYRHVVELPDKTIKANKWTIGDTITLH